MLAAGGSRRLGRPKQLLKHRGRSLLLRAVEHAEHATPGRVVIVLGAHAPRLGVVLDRAGITGGGGAGARAGARAGRFAGAAAIAGARGHAAVTRNPRWRSGMAASLQAGIRALPRDAAAALILLTDQPQLTNAAVTRLVTAWQENPAIAAAAGYSGRVGVPAVLPVTWWRDIRKLQGDEGARTLLAAAEALNVVAMPEAAADIDTADDAAHWVASGSGPCLPGRRRLRKRRSRS